MEKVEDSKRAMERKSETAREHARDRARKKAKTQMSASESRVAREELSKNMRAREQESERERATTQESERARAGESAGERACEREHTRECEEARARARESEQERDLRARKRKILGDFERGHLFPHVTVRFSAALLCGCWHVPASSVHPHVWRGACLCDSFTRVTQLVYTCVAWLGQMCGMTRELAYKRDMTRLHVWHDIFTCVPLQVRCSYTCLFVSTGHIWLCWYRYFLTHYFL